MSSPMSIKKTSLAIAVTSVISGLVLITAPAHAAPELTLSQPATGSTTIIEQSFDGQVATITATPNGITMQDGSPLAVTQVINVPRYAINNSTRQGTTTITTLSAPATTQVTQMSVIDVPVDTSTQVLLPVITNTVPTLDSQTIVNQAVPNQVITNQTATNIPVSAISLDTLQFTPVFSTPDIVTAKTKIMKVLKNSAGEEFAVPANKIASGDIIEYHTTYTNTANQQVNDLNAVVTLPNGIKLVSLNSPLSTMASTGTDNYQIIQQVGDSIAIQENYSNLKWNMVNLASNAPQTVVIRAKVQ